jgi:hypothetical protein
VAPPAAPPPAAAAATGDPYAGINGEGGSDIFGTAQTQRANQNAQVASAAAKNVAGQAYGVEEDAKKKGAGYDKGLAASLGANAADYMKKAQAAAMGQATDEAQAASTQAAQKAAMTARSMGLNPGEAAITGGQQVGDVYQNQLQAGLNAGRSEYGQGAQMIGQAGSEMAGRQQAGMSTQLQAGNLASGVGAQAQAQADNIGKGWLGFGTQALGAFLSDKRAKRLIIQARGLSKGIEDDIKPTSFEYKPGMGDGGGIPNEGVLADDVAKSKIGGVVQTGPDGLKRIDSNKTVGALLALVSDLSSRLEALEGGK